MQSLPDIINL